MPSILTSKIDWRGFTLIELSIVLVVIGLLVGGILVGRDLIYTAELRSVVSQLEKYDTAVLAFRLKFGCLPGDCPNAMDFGLGDASCPSFNLCPLSPPASSYVFAGCNGNGNANLSVEFSTMDFGWCPENLNFWHHLSRAGLISGFYDGKSLSTDGWPIYGVSSPQTRLRNIGIAAMFNSYYVGSNQDTGNPDLTPFEAEFIDGKRDDGRPLSGKVRILIGGGCHDAASNMYNTAWTTGQCSIRVLEIPGFSPPQNL